MTSEPSRAMDGLCAAAAAAAASTSTSSARVAMAGLRDVGARAMVVFCVVKVLLLLRLHKVAVQFV